MGGLLNMMVSINECNVEYEFLLNWAIGIKFFFSFEKWEKVEGVFYCLGVVKK